MNLIEKLGIEKCKKILNECTEAFERYQADLTGSSYEELRAHFDDCEKSYGTRYYIDSTYKNEWGVWRACWESRQAEVDALKGLLEKGEHAHNLYYDNANLQTLVEEKDKRIKQALSELESLHNKKWAEWKEQADMHSQGEANAYEHAMQILEKALRGEHE